MTFKTNEVVIPSPFHRRTIRLSYYIILYKLSFIQFHIFRLRLLNIWHENFPVFPHERSIQFLEKFEWNFTSKRGTYLFHNSATTQQTDIELLGYHSPSAVPIRNDYIFSWCNDLQIFTTIFFLVDTLVMVFHDCAISNNTHVDVE